MGIALEVDVSRPAEGGHAQADPHRVRFLRLGVFDFSDLQF